MKYQVKDPQGQLHVIEGPEGATPDQIIAQAQKLIPTQPPDWQGIVGNAVGNAFMQPGTITRKLASDPIAQAKALPPLAGMGGAISGIPGGTTMGTGLGRALSDAALTSYGRKDLIPSAMQHGTELVLAGLGDIAPIPLMHKAARGAEIGALEDATGIVTRGATKAVTPGSVGETLNNLEAQLDAGAINTPQAAKDAKEVVDQIYRNPNIYEKSNGISVQAQRVSAKVQKTLNSMVPGRELPAQQMATAMTIPNKLGDIYKSVPKTVRYGIGALGGGALIDEIVKKLIAK